MNFPGLIDLQINGYIGIDFSSPDLTEADAIRAFEAIVKSGARGFFPTIVTSPLALFERNLPILARAMSDRIWGKHALGIHVEGPFLCPLPGYIGAHKPEWALDPDPEREPLKDLDALSGELERFDPELAARPSIVALSKADLPETKEAAPALREALKERGVDELYVFSAVTGEGVDALLDALERLLGAHPDRPAPRAEPLE